MTTQRIFELTKELPISVKQIGVIWNSTSPDVNHKSPVGNKLDAVETFGCVPYDESVFEAMMQGKTVFELEDNSPALLAVRKILEKKLLANPAMKSG
jgi:CO dehydrogenase nickel-insertion accessory protein CooC1